MNSFASWRSLAIVGFVILLGPAFASGAATRAQTITNPCDAAAGKAEENVLGDGDAVPGVPLASEVPDAVEQPAGASATLSPSSEPPVVVNLQLDRALAEVEKWDRATWDGRAEVELDPDPLPVERTRAFVISQADDGGTPPTVLLCLGTPVPDLKNRTFPQAQTALADAGLASGAVQGAAVNGATVATQTVAPGRLVSFGTAVGFTLVAPDAASPAVAVPEIVEPSPEGVKRDQAPDDIDPASASSPMFMLGALLALVLGILAARRVRSELQRRWALAHVTAEIRRAGRPEISSDGADDPPACVARLEPHADAGTQTLEEVPR